MARTNWVQLGVVGLGIFGLYQGSQGKLPTTIQGSYDKYIGRSGAAPSLPSGGQGKPGCWDSTTAGIPAKYGPLWCQSHSMAPQSVKDLSDWGDANGYRNPQNGVWAN